MVYLVTTKSLASYTINDWHFEPQRRKLTLDQTTVELTPLQSGIVAVLVERHPELVTANELLELLSEHAQDNRNKLYQSIAKLRKVFGDSSHNAHYIKTVPRKGYCLVPTPKIVAQEPLSAEPEAIENEQVHSGVLEQNIFDDLGFISDTSQEQEQEQEQTLPVSAQPFADKQVLTSVTASKIPAKAYVVFVLILVMTFGYIFSGSAPKEPAMVVPDVLYIGKLDTNSDAQGQASLHVQWWLSQKLQHLPLIKVTAQQHATQFPQIKPKLIYQDGKISSLTLEYRLAQETPLHTISLIIPAQVDAQAIANASEFNRQIVSVILDSSDLLLSNDVCLAQDFISPKESDNTQCLVTHYAQSQHDEAVWQPQQLIERFGLNSLGYHQAALSHFSSGNYAAAMESISLALARNTNAPEILQLKSKLHRQLSQFMQSAALEEQLITLEPSIMQHHYWLSHDLIALGYRERANHLLKLAQIEITTISDILYFNPLNYNTIKTWLASGQSLSPTEFDLIREHLTGSEFDSSVVLASQLRNIEQLENSARIDRHWRIAGLYLASGQINKGKSAIEDEHALEQFIDTFSLNSDDRIFYLPSYTNLLLKSGQPELAKRILERIILLAQGDSHDTRWTLLLAEAYALDGQTTQALAQLSKLLATGWLPHPQRQLWTLRNNPNFISLEQEWEFLNLLELIENRQALMLMELAESKSAIVQ